MTTPRGQAGSSPSDVEAREQQLAMADRVRMRDDDRAIRTVCGVDVAYADNSERLVAAAAVLEWAELEVVDHAVVEGTTTFPYIPGLLSFREAPWVLDAIQNLDEPPDVVICDGNGVAHPARFGPACHVGVELDIPTIGCAKNHLVGSYEAPGPNRGDRSPILLDGDVVGTVLRTQDHVKPVFVSPGHLVTVERAAEIVLKAAAWYRLPETTRAADHLARAGLSS